MPNNLDHFFSSRKVDIFGLRIPRTSASTIPTSCIHRGYCHRRSRDDDVVHCALIKSKCMTLLFFIIIISCTSVFMLNVAVNIAEYAVLAPKVDVLLYNPGEGVCCAIFSQENMTYSLFSTNSGWPQLPNNLKRDPYADNRYFFHSVMSGSLNEILSLVFEAAENFSSLLTVVLRQQC